MIPPEIQAELAKEFMERTLRDSPLANMLRRYEMEKQLGPIPRTVLFKCTGQCMLHHCNQCGTRVVYDGDADPRMCTPEKQPGRLCADCAGAS